MTDLGRIAGPLVIPNCVEVALVWDVVPTKTARNVLHATVGGGFNATAVIAQAVYAAIIASGDWAAYKPYVNGACGLHAIEIRDLRTAGMPLVQSTGGATAGTGAALALPAGVAATLTLRTASAGRNARGRVYLPGLDSTCLNAATGLFSAAFQTAAVNFLGAVQTALGASAMTLALANPARASYTGTTGYVHPARSATALAVTSIEMRDLRPDSQRRRGQSS